MNTMASVETAAVPSHNAEWQALPADLLLSIFSQLELTSLVSVQCTCKRWASVCDQEQVSSPSPSDVSDLQRL